MEQQHPYRPTSVLYPSLDLKNIFYRGFLIMLIFSLIWKMTSTHGIVVHLISQIGTDLNHCIPQLTEKTTKLTGSNHMSIATTRSGSVLMGLIPHTATNSSLCNIEALSLLVQKLWPRLSFFLSRSKVKVKVTKSKILVSTERSYHKECTCVILYT